MLRRRSLFSVSNLHFNTVKLHLMQGALLCNGYADEAMDLVTEGRWFHSRKRQGIFPCQKR
jgi:hypothetical protein